MFKSMKQAFQGLSDSLIVATKLKPSPKTQSNATNKNTHSTDHKPNTGEDAFYTYLRIVHSKVQESLRTETKGRLRDNNSGGVSQQDVDSLHSFIKDYYKIVGKDSNTKRIFYVTNSLYAFLYDHENERYQKKLTSGNQIHLTDSFVLLLARVFNADIKKVYLSNQNGTAYTKNLLKDIVSLTFRQASNMTNEDIDNIVNFSKGVNIGVEEERMIHYFKSCYTQFAYYRTTDNVTSLETLKGVQIDDKGLAYFELFISDYQRRTAGRTKEYKVNYIRLIALDLVGEIYRITRTLEAISHSANSREHRGYLRELKTKVAILSAVFDCRFLSNFLSSIHDVEANDKYITKCVSQQYDKVCRG